MKEKRYFCDWYDGLKSWEWSLLFFIILGIATVISKPFVNRYPIAIFKDNLNKSYEYLYDIARNTVNEGVGINIKAIPEDVKYNIDYGGENIIFKYYCDSDGDGIDEDMIIILSKDFKIISLHSDIIEKQEVLNNNPEILNKEIKKLTFGYQLLAGFFFTLLMESVRMFVYDISKNHKQKKQNLS